MFSVVNGQQWVVKRSVVFQGALVDARVLVSSYDAEDILDRAGNNASLHTHLAVQSESFAGRRRPKGHDSCVFTLNKALNDRFNHCREKLLLRL